MIPGFIIYNHRIKKIANRIWKSKFIAQSACYRYFLGRQIAGKIRQYRDRPKCVRIENTNICNAGCIMCPRDKMTRPQGIMEGALYEAIIKQCVESGINDMNLHNFGEPLLDKGLPEKISLAKAGGIRHVSTNSNASLLTPEVSARLLNAGIDELFVSIDAASQNIFESVRRGLNYQRVMGNLMDFVSLKKRQKARTKLIVSFVLTPQNSAEADGFVSFWKGRADHVSVSYAHDWAGAGKDTLANRRLKNPCKLPFTDLVIGWNGDYILCCADFDATVKLGNFKDAGIIKTWRENAGLNQYRKAHLKDHGFSISPCRECTLNTIWWF